MTARIVRQKAEADKQAGCEGIVTILSISHDLMSFLCLAFREFPLRYGSPAPASNFASNRIHFQPFTDFLTQSVLPKMRSVCKGK